MVASSRIAATAAVSLAFGAGFVAADAYIQENFEEWMKVVDEYDGFPQEHFKSSDIVAPTFHVNQWDKSLTDDTPYMFLGATYNGVGAGPMIFDASDLSLVYANQGYTNCYHSEPQTIAGKPHLTFWGNTKDSGSGCHVLDEDYKWKYTAKPKNGHNSDMHDCHITEEATAVFTTHRTIDFDCRPWGGKEECKVHDTGFQEVDLETGEEIFGWWCSDHFKAEDTYARFEADDFGLNKDKEGAWDLSHINGVRKTEDGNYLISVRHYFAVRLVNGKDGSTIWTLGGKTNDFEDLSDGKATSMAWQHNARFYHNQTQITMFDNHLENQGNCGNDCHSRGLHVGIDTEKMTAELLGEWYHPEHQDSLAMGGMHKMDSGNVIVGWGWTPAITEFTADGRVAMDLQRGKINTGRQNNMFAYRVWKGDWTGKPSSPPKMVVEDGNEGTKDFYMTWNGATGVKSWGVYALPDNPGDDPKKIAESNNKIGESDRQGFETRISVESDKVARYVVVAALDKDGEVMRASEIHDMGEEFSGNQGVTLDEEEEEPTSEEKNPSDDAPLSDDGPDDNSIPAPPAEDTTLEDTTPSEDKTEEKVEEETAPKDGGDVKSKLTESPARTGGLFFGILCSGGVAYAAVSYLRRRRRGGHKEAKYTPMLSHED